jgi:hypothetical protein
MPASARTLSKPLAREFFMVNWQVYTGSATEWNDQLGALSGATLYQSYEWGDYRKRLGWVPLRMVGTLGGQSVAMAQVLTKRRFGFCIAWLPGGPAGFTEQWSRTLTRALKKHFGYFLYCRMNAFAPCQELVKKELEASGWRRPRSSLTSGLSMEIDLVPDIDTRIGKASGNWRHNLKRSAKYGLEISHWAVPDVDEMSRVYREMERLKGLPEQHSPTALAALIGAMGPNLIVFQCRDGEGNLIALRGAGIFGQRAWDLLAAATGAARKVYATHATLWALTEHCRSSGATHYDLGGVDPQGNKGVYDFKQGTGAASVKYLGEWEWSGMPFLSRAANIAINRTAKVE